MSPNPAREAEKVKRPTKRKRRVSKAPKRIGRPPFRPTEKQRVEVQTLAIVGFPLDAIERYLGHSEWTLRKYFREELEMSRPKLLGNAVGVIARALAGEETDRRSALSAAFFTLKTQGKAYGWSERIEVTGKDGVPLFDLSKLTEAELDQWEALQRKALGNVPPSNVHPEHGTAQ